MDINNQLSSIVETLVNDIKQQVETNARDSIGSYLDQAILDYDLDTKITTLANVQLANKIGQYEFNTVEIKRKLDQAGQQAVDELTDNIRTQVIDNVNQQIAKIDFGSIVKEYIQDSITSNFKNLTFPDNSINASSIKQDQLALSGDQVSGGIITQFSSTGIDDKATQCQVTILDTHVVVEQPILTTGINVKGDAVIDGNLTINGEIPADSAVFKSLTDNSVAAVKAALNTELFQSYSDVIFNDIKEKGLDLSLITIDGKTVLTANELAPAIVKSNLRRVGELTELQVRGETLLDNTMYVAGKRVGINTLEPSGALAVWDEEVELVVRKKSNNVGYVGSTRDVTFILGSNNKENISLDPDGSVTINDLRLGALPISTASSEPSWEGRTAEIVFNDSPAVGLPIGWVCLGGHRWANFGTIQE